MEVQGHPYIVKWHHGQNMMDSLAMVRVHGLSKHGPVLDIHVLLNGIMVEDQGL